MSNPSKQKGTKWETDCLELIKELYPEAVRSPAWGAEDRGDLYGTGQYTFECKAVKSHDLAGFIEEAKTEAQNAGTKFPVVFLKRRNKSTSQGYAIMEIGSFIELMKKAEEE